MYMYVYIYIYMYISYTENVYLSHILHLALEAAMTFRSEAVLGSPPKRLRLPKAEVPPLFVPLDLIETLGW